MYIEISCSKCGKIIRIDAKDIKGFEYLCDECFKEKED